MAETPVERVEQRRGGFRDHRTGREDRFGAGGLERLVILRRDHAADHDHDVGAAVAAELGFEFRHQRQMRAGERGDAEDVHVVLDRLARGFRRRREQGPDIDVEAEIGERRGDHLLAAVMAVLADLGDQDARAAAFLVLEFGDALLHPLDGVRHADLPPVDAGDRLDLRLVAPEHLLQRQ